MYHLFFIHLPVDGHLGCFHVLAFVISAVMNNGVHVSFQIMFFSEYMPRSGIARSYDSSILSFLRNLHTLLHSGSNNLHSHQNSAEGFPSLHTLSSIYRSWIFLDDTHSRWCKVISHLTCISLIISNVEHLFM